MNDQPKRIADAMRSLVEALPGCKGIQLHTSGGWTSLQIEAATDEDVHALSAALGVQVEFVDLPEGVSGPVWWLRGKDHADKLHVAVEGPHHQGQRQAFDGGALTSAIEDIAREIRCAAVDVADAIVMLATPRAARAVVS